MPHSRGVSKQLLLEFLGGRDYYWCSHASCLAEGDTEEEKGTKAR
jgi:hypothetical protein